jgi:hypothetical protein
VGGLKRMRCNVFESPEHSLYIKQSTMLKNKVHGEAVLGEPSKAGVRSLKRSLTQLKKEM